MEHWTEIGHKSEWIESSFKMSLVILMSWYVLAGTLFESSIR